MSMTNENVNASPVAPREPTETTSLPKEHTSQVITSDEVHGGGLGDVAAAPGYDDGELDLVVQGVERLGHLDGGGGRAGVEKRRGRLQEQHGLMWSERRSNED
jgi:hypothetical protein